MTPYLAALAPRRRRRTRQVPSNGDAAGGFADCHRIHAWRGIGARCVTYWPTASVSAVPQCQCGCEWLAALARRPHDRSFAPNARAPSFAPTAIAKKNFAKKKWRRRAGRSADETRRSALFGNRGRSLFPFLARLRILFGSGGAERAGLLEHGVARLSTHAAGATLNLKDRTRLADAIAALGPIDNLVVGVSADVAWGPFNTLKMDAELAALNMKLIGYLAAASRADEPPSAVRSPSSAARPGASRCPARWDWRR